MQYGVGYNYVILFVPFLLLLSPPTSINKRIKKNVVLIHLFMAGFF